MDTNKILSADILDIVFEGRNKEYGAYDLRKTYQKRLIIAVISMIAFCILIFISVALAKFVASDKPVQMVVQDVNLADVKQEEKKPEPPPPPPPKVEPPKVEITKFTPPKIVKDEEVKPEEKPPEQDKLDDTKIGTINQEGEKSDVVAPPVEQSTGQVEAPKAQEEDYDKEFKTVQIEAKFPGGQAAWIKYLQRNLNSDTPVENGAPPGNYTVIVSFLVDKNGNISEVQPLNDPGYGTAAEAVRVIKKGPAWSPAVQNGRNVIYRQKQSVTFQVAEG
ncbi:energy transducer TonB [Panacibacter ginsenosidivorans]|uniref:Energy transducer TonB n=1 Tax=Panacibacter ginsenosidivorans TaxID=1813871 RepID=A0A5B8V5N5_9BACT|nr:energy transducer TonB [Panacibacter ginsenosidivorans]QEC66532.1 energy transducer TonB [Panacibacter ginsenosidivorans]